VETTGLHEWEDNQRVVTLGVSWSEGRAAVIPIHHQSVENNWYRVLRELKPILEDKSKRFIAHNGKFDCKWLAKEGIYVPLTFDTMIAAHLLDENRPKGLKILSQMLLGADDYDEDTKDCYNANLKRLAIYNGKDCDYTLRLYYIFREQLKKEPRVARVFKKLMMPASDVFTRIELIGTYIDPERHAERTVTTEETLLRIERFMNQFLPKGMETINYNSPQQVALWLFTHLKLPILERTKTGAPSTAEGVLLRLASKHRAVEALLKYRKWSKYLSTYLRPYERRDHKSRIHPSYRLTGTTTGRLSSAEPNLQQVPRSSFIRGIVGAPPGWQLMEADYSQIELRLAAWMANERTMLDVLAAGEDLHDNTARSIATSLRVKYDRVIWGKHPNFGLLYGMYPKKYVEYCRDNGGLEISLDEAEEVYDTFHATYPALRRWHRRQIRLAYRYQRVSSPIGRIRHLPDARNANDSVRMEAERQAINSPVQGLASDLMLFSAVRLAKILDPRRSRLVGSVHDQLLLEVREDAVGDIAPLVRRTMEDTTALKRVFGVRLEVPILVEIKVGTHWSEGTTFTPDDV
jgi:DNA polymerase-1